MDPAYVSAFSALAGAAIGSLASFSTSWVTQRTQIRHTQSEAERARLEALYSEFITESARLLGDALSNQKDDIADMVGLRTGRAHAARLPFPSWLLPSWLGVFGELLSWR